MNRSRAWVMGLEFIGLLIISLVILGSMGGCGSDDPVDVGYDLSVGVEIVSFSGNGSVTYSCKNTSPYKSVQVTEVTFQFGFQDGSKLVRTDPGSYFILTSGDSQTRTYSLITSKTVSSVTYQSSHVEAYSIPMGK